MHAATPACLMRKKMALVMSLSEIERREASPHAGVIDSQSVKSTESGGVRGYDAGKKIKGRTRHIPTDTRGSWFSFSCMQPIFRTGTGPSMCSWQSADASRGCAMPSPVVATPGRNCATRSPAMATGLSRSSGDLMPQKLRAYATAMGRRAHICVARTMLRLGIGLGNVRLLINRLDAGRVRSHAHPKNRKILLCLRKL